MNYFEQKLLKKIFIKWSIIVHKKAVEIEMIVLPTIIIAIIIISLAKKRELPNLQFAILT